MDNNELGTNLAEVGTDCISRQAAIDALRAMQTYKLFAGDDMLLIDQAGAQTELMLLPSAQPEIIRCNSCKHWTQSTGKMKGYGLGRCDFHDADLVACNGFCYWAERRTNG